MTRRTRRLLCALVGLLAVLAASLAAVAVARWRHPRYYDVPPCYVPAPPDIQPAPQESLRDEMLRTLAATGKLPAKVVVKAMRSGRP